MKWFPCFEREPEENSEMVSLSNDQNLDIENHLCDHNQKVNKKKTYIIMAKGQPLKLQPSMLRDSNWMRVFNSIVPNITMIPNGGNRSKLGIDILNKQDSKALASSNEREPDSWNSIPWNCTQTPKQDEEKYQTSTLQFFQPAHVQYATKTTQFYPI